MLTSLIPLRDENPTHRFPLVTVALIAGCVIVYLATGDSLLGPSVEAVFRYGAVPCDVVGRCPFLPPGVGPILASRSSLASLVTSMFMHADIFHLGFNMLFLWVFGNNVEDRLGHVRFALFYLATGLAAAFAHILVNPTSIVPVVGASGAISGVLGAYIVLWPHAAIVSLVPLGFFFTTVRTPAWVTLGLWFVVQIFGGLAGLGRPDGGGVAYLAHIGGFVAGLVLVLVVGGRKRVRPYRYLDDD